MTITPFAKVIRYRVHTEHVSHVLVGRYFDGFSIVRAQGYYAGEAEASVIIEIIGTEADNAKVLSLARDIREQYRQAEVWIASDDVTLTRVTIDATLTGLPVAVLEKTT